MALSVHINLPMESLQAAKASGSSLTGFFQRVTTWPKEEARLVSIAQHVCETCDLALCAILGDNAISLHIAENSQTLPNPDMNLKMHVEPDQGTLATGYQESRFIKTTGFKEILKKQVQVLAQEKNRTFETGVWFDPFPWPSVQTPLRNLVISITPLMPSVGLPSNLDVNFPGSQQIAEITSNNVNHKRQISAWLIVGANRGSRKESEKQLFTLKETTLVAIAHHLNALISINQLETLVQSRNQFLSMASHELKTPLTSIYGILQLQERMLQGQPNEMSQVSALPTNERQKNLLRTVIRQVERLNDLINGLLDISRIQIGRFIVEPSEVNVSAIFNEVIHSRLSLIAEENGVRLTAEAPPALVAWVDQVRIEEVITNLIMNAIRFSPEGGVVWIRLKGDSEDFQLLVRDQGPSVSMGDRERIFQPFEKTQRTSRLGGSGLGLFISRQIAQLHGGNVNLVESIPGKGNLFEAHFPIQTK